MVGAAPPHDPLSDELIAESLFEDPLIIAAGPQSRRGRLSKIDLADIVDEPWVLSPPGSGNYSDMAEVFRLRDLPTPKFRVLTSSVLLRVHLLANGPFITAVSKSIANRHSLKVLPVDLPIRTSSQVIITLKNRTSSPIVGLFVEHVREFARSMRDSKQAPRRITALPKG